MFDLHNRFIASQAENQAATDREYIKKIIVVYVTIKGVTYRCFLISNNKVVEIF